uniref:Uncharacterized protein n=1 Tax=Utricularia reniformis TaxID=192314 RepID=A0A1Y0AZV8_9LAMI|nr:hypothetical protein AEK19_MT0434 [Utricularia reniformis]ART30697.1 hypothetical protein AEK19_MT0434 [Utricularia reniformis]
MIPPRLTRVKEMECCISGYTSSPGVLGEGVITERLPHLFFSFSSSSDSVVFFRLGQLLLDLGIQ